MSDSVRDQLAAIIANAIGHGEPHVAIELVVAVAVLESELLTPPARLAIELLRDGSEALRFTGTGESCTALARFFGDHHRGEIAQWKSRTYDGGWVVQGGRRVEFSPDDWIVKDALGWFDVMRLTPRPAVPVGMTAEAINNVIQRWTAMLGRVEPILAIDEAILDQLRAWRDAFEVAGIPPNPAETR